MFASTHLIAPAIFEVMVVNAPTASDVIVVYLHGKMPSQAL